jgi:hypothetical protein
MTKDITLTPDEPVVINFRNEKGELLAAVEYDNDKENRHLKVPISKHDFLIMTDIDV